MSIVHCCWQKSYNYCYT